tara:strand:- start:1601 stop:2326 length:726 start_codon:yes stop_codon:yes gene_type:complete
MTVRYFPILFGIVLSCGLSIAQDEGESGGSSLGDLFKKVKDLKVPDSVSNLPTQITELKESYLETAKTVETLRIEVDQLREEVYMLRTENKALQEAVGVKVKESDLAAMLKPIEISATDLAAEYKADRNAAEGKYRDRYLKVVGVVAGFETGAQTIELFLKAEGTDSKIRCKILTGPDLYVDVLPSQGRMVSRNDRSPLLSVGQPVAVIGTCSGAGLNVELINCRIDGLEEKRIVKPEPKK